ncbi:MAG: amidohydrolase family protein, partial [Gammaproteobacteria bacterium]
MLIRRAEIAPGQLADVRVDRGRVVEIGAALPVRADEEAIDAAGAALLPGLHDHHIHLRALAASLASARCGPPEVRDAAALAAALRAADAQLGTGEWLRGIGYHESVAGELDRDALDALLPDRPLRIQHRSGRLWIFNSAGLDRLAPDAAAPLERRGGRWTGRLYDADDWLGARLHGTPPALHAASRWLASRGVTGVTDTTHHNGPDALRGVADACARGELLQQVRVMGDARLDAAGDLPGVQRGEHKFHLHEHALPELDGLIAAIRASHAAGRAVAFHCVTRTELVFALA